jgi:putative transposase
MPSTYSSIHFHFVFSTKLRQSLIDGSWRNRLFGYLGGTVGGLGGTPLAIGGTANHVHLLVGLQASHRICDILRELKHESSQWVHKEVGVADFSWQKGYGAFSVSESELEVIKNYIVQQQEQHRKKSFEQEYIELLQENRVDYDERYLW